MSAITTSGKRKKAIARAVIKEGKGIIRINHQLLSTFEPAILRLKIMEPIILADKAAAKFDIEVNVQGGGITSQAEAARLAIARGIVKQTGDASIEKMFDDYDRNMLVADVRRKEARKPNTNSKARAKKQKSYR
jgi:small subunit ribosomal protein S9